MTAVKGTKPTHAQYMLLCLATGTVVDVVEVEYGRRSGAMRDVPTRLWSSQLRARTHIVVTDLGVTDADLDKLQA